MTKQSDDALSMLEQTTRELVVSGESRSAQITLLKWNGRVSMGDACPSTCFRPSRSGSRRVASAHMLLIIMQPILLYGHHEWDMKIRWLVILVKATGMKWWDDNALRLSAAFVLLHPSSPPHC